MSGKDTGDTTPTQLRRVLQNQWDSEENRRAEIFSVLHSDIGQLLTAIKFQIAKAGTAIEKKEGEKAIKEHLASIGALTDEVAAFLRGIMKTLRSEMLENFGLSDALEWKIDRIRTEEMIRVSFQNNLAANDEVTRIHRVVFTVFTALLDTMISLSQIRSIEVAARVSEGRIRIESKISTDSALDTVTTADSFQNLVTELSERLRIHRGSFAWKLTGSHVLKSVIAVPS